MLCKVNTIKNMGSPSLVFKFGIPCLFLLLSAFYSNYTANGLDSQKVNLSVYYEALNRTCAVFIVKNLARIFNNGLSDIVNLRLVPSGNAYANASSNATGCPNDLDECEFNVMQACTINTLTDVNKHYALIYCFEFLAIEGRYKEWKTCFGSLGLPSKSVLACLNSINGKKLEENYANETAQLNPPRTFVPWVVVNNQSIGNDYRNFTFYACKAYNGTSVPNACQTSY